MSTERPSHAEEPDSGHGWEDDPSWLHARREASLILGLWACCLVWTTTYCYLFGYLSHEPLPPGKSLGPDIAAIVGPLEEFDRDPATLTTPFGLGVPDWVFWGILAPWLVCIVVTILFCNFVFVEDKLTSDQDPEERAEK